MTAAYRTRAPWRNSAGMLALAAIGVLAGHAQQVAAACIPGTAEAFRSTLATLDRPFARPGDWVEITLDPTCHAASPGFQDVNGNGIGADDVVVTIVFTPPGGALPNVVALATSCAGIGACPGVTSFTCVQVNQPSDPVNLEVPDAGHVRFRFPDTDAVFAAPTFLGNDSDGLTFSGPATIAVTHAGASLPCALVMSPCDPATQPDVLACADDFFTDNGIACDTMPHNSFPHFTALPPANDYRAVCTDGDPPCTGTSPDLRFAVDKAGNLLIPMDWHGVLVSRDAVPVPRLWRIRTSVEAFEGGIFPIAVPSDSFLASYCPEGGKLPPVFAPHAAAAASGELVLFGFADAPDTVLRVARAQCVGGTSDGLSCSDAAGCSGGTCGPLTCIGGSSDGGPCASDADCSGGLCQLGVFDFTTRHAAGAGPVVFRRNTCVSGPNQFQPCSGCGVGQCGDFRASALDAVPLDALSESPAAYALVEEEAVAGGDLNGDGDAVDHVVKLLDRSTGLIAPLNGAVEGRAVTRVRQPPFSFPAVVLDGNVLALLEPEPLQGYLDANGNGQVFETILRAFRLDPGVATNLTAAAAVAADGAPLVNHRALAISDGFVFYRRPEAARARQRIDQVEGTNTTGHVVRAVLSADRRFVAFDSDASDLVAGDTNGTFDVFVYDRTTHITERVSVDSNGTQGDGPSSDDRTGPAISGDGRFVAFASGAANLVEGDTNGVFDTFVKDRLTGVTERVSVNSGGLQGDGDSFAPAISADGRFVAFQSVADNLVAGDTNGNFDIFVHDRQTGETEQVDLNQDGLPGGSDHGFYSFPPTISANGRFVVFTTKAQLVPDDTNPRFDVYVRDRQNGVTERVSVSTTGEQGNEEAWFTTSISADGRFVAFSSYASNLVTGDTNGQVDVFVRDRQTHTTERVSVDSSGTEADSRGCAGCGGGYGPAISSDGRFVAFTSVSTNLVPGDTDLDADVFVHDTQTGMTGRVSAYPDGTQLGGSQDAAISGDGRAVAFNFGRRFIFVHGPDGGDLASDIFSDGQIDDTVLEVLDGTTGATTTLCPATDVAIAAGKAAFLRPESAIGTAACPGGSLNGDADTADLVVQLWPGSGPVENLGVAATALSMSDAYLAALVSEQAQGNSDLNGDGDANDTVVEVHAVGGGLWTNTQQAADVAEVCGSVFVFITPEAAQRTDLNGDGDQSDRVLQLYNASTGALINVGQAAEDFVCGPSLVAFRTREAAQGQNLNGDSDTNDDVLQVYDIGRPECLMAGHPANCLLNSRQAVTPCSLEACDPRVPYRLGADTVTFLTFECDQGGSQFNGCPGGGTDLNGDGDAGDLVLQTFNARIAQLGASTLGGIARRSLLRGSVVASPSPIRDRGSDERRNLHGHGASLRQQHQLPPRHVLRPSRRLHPGSRDIVRPA